MTYRIASRMRLQIQTLLTKIVESETQYTRERQGGKVHTGSFAHLVEIIDCVTVD